MKIYRAVKDLNLKLFIANCNLQLNKLQFGLNKNVVLKSEKFAIKWYNFILKC